MNRKAVLKIQKTKKQSTPRMLWPDVVRIIAIYLVIQLHTSYTYVTSHYAGTLLNKIDTMGVPLFVLVSGALLLGKSEDYKTFFRKRSFKVLIPWIIWTLLYMSYAFNTNHSQIVKDFFSDNKPFFYHWTHFFFRFFMSSLYFLPLIFGIYILTPILRVLVKNTTNFDNFYIIVLWFIILSMLPWIINGPLFPTWEPTIIYSPIQFSGYFLLGFIVIKQQTLEKIPLPLLFLMSVLPFLLILIPANSVYLNNFIGGYLAPGIVLASLFFFYFVYVLFKKIDKKINPFIRKLVTLISGASFGVYLLNEMFTDFFKNELIYLSTVLHSEFLASIVTFLIITLIILLLQKIPIIKYIVP